MKKTTGSKARSFRIPHFVMRWLKQQAIANRRSATAELLQILCEEMARREGR